MRGVWCDFCGDIINTEDIYEVETCHTVTGVGLSFEICEHCHYELKALSEGISLDLLIQTE